MTNFIKSNAEGQSNNDNHSRSWEIHDVDTSVIVDDEWNIGITTETRTEKPSCGVPDKLYSSLKYDQYHRISGTLAKQFGFLVVKLKVVDPETKEEIKMGQNPMLKGTTEASVKTKGTEDVEAQLRWQFTGCSYHHKRKRFAFLSSYYRPTDIHSPIVQIISSPFKVFARKQTNKSKQKQPKERQQQQQRQRKGQEQGQVHQSLSPLHYLYANESLNNTKKRTAQEANMSSLLCQQPVAKKLRRSGIEHRNEDDPEKNKGKEPIGLEIGTDDKGIGGVKRGKKGSDVVSGKHGNDGSNSSNSSCSDVNNSSNNSNHHHHLQHMKNTYDKHDHDDDYDDYDSSKVSSYYSDPLCAFREKLAELVVLRRRLTPEQQRSAFELMRWELMSSQFQSLHHQDHFNNSNPSSLFSTALLSKDHSHQQYESNKDSFSCDSSSFCNNNNNNNINYNNNINNDENQNNNNNYNYNLSPISPSFMNDFSHLLGATEEKHATSTPLSLSSFNINDGQQNTSLLDNNAVNLNKSETPSTLQYDDLLDISSILA